MIMPRPDLAALGVSYRRIPVLSIGRDIYNDTRLILRKLEQLFPPSAAHPSITPTSPSSLAVQKLLEIWTVDSGMFSRAAQLSLSSSPVMKDKKFIEDRKHFTTGLLMNLEALKAGVPEAAADIRGAFNFLETTLLADGRDWILGSREPTVADIEAVWPFVWLKSNPTVLPPTLISPTQFPKTFAWITRFQAYAKSNYKKPPSLKGPEVTFKIEKSAFAEEEGSVDEKDLSGLKKGQDVLVWPIDSGSRNKDRGSLSSLSMEEIVIERKTEKGVVVRIHAPRHGFRVVKVDESKL